MSRSNSSLYLVAGCCITFCMHRMTIIICSKLSGSIYMWFAFCTLNKIQLNENFQRVVAMIIVLMESLHASNEQVNM